MMYADAQAFPHDYQEAMTWYRMASQRGVALAQHGLGMMHMQGKGVIQDQVRAPKWFSIAGEKGNRRALESRDALVGSMTPEQIAEAQRMAHDCKESDYKKCD